MQNIYSRGDQILAGAMRKDVIREEMVERSLLGKKKVGNMG